MKRKLFLSAVAAFLLLFVGYGCSDNSLSEDDIQRMINNSLDGQWKIINFEVDGRDWDLVENNQGESYYSITFDLPELTENIFREGAVHGYYKLDNNKKTALPYVKTMKDSDGFAYTDTYRCVFQLGNPSTVTFHLESLDLAIYTPNPPSADFQVLLIY